MSWIFGTSTDWIDLSNDVVAAATGTSLQSVDSIAAGGTGYAVDNILTLSGGTGTISAQVEVTSVSAGAVTGVRIYQAGLYSAAPGDPVATTGAGSGCTLNCTFATNGWTAERNTAYSGSEREVILNGSGDGGDEIFIGWRTYSSVPGDYYNWELNGFTGFDSGLTTPQQPGVSPGKWNAASGFRAGAYLPLDNASIGYAMSITPYRIILVAIVGSSYFNAILGWANRYATEGEFPYPLLVGGCMSEFNGTSGSSGLRSGLVDPWRTAGTEGQDRGPMFIRSTDGTWIEVRNAQISGSTKTESRTCVVIPAGRPDGSINGAVSPQNDRFTLVDASWGEVIPLTAAIGASTANLQPTPGTLNRTLLFPATIVLSTPAKQILADLPDVFWISGFGAIGSEDRIRIPGGAAYRVFQNCNRTENYAYLAVKEI